MTNIYISEYIKDLINGSHRANDVDVYVIKKAGNTFTAYKTTVINTRQKRSAENLLDETNDSGHARKDVTSKFKAMKGYQSVVSSMDKFAMDFLLYTQIEWTHIKNNADAANFFKG